MIPPPTTYSDLEHYSHTISNNSLQTIHFLKIEAFNEIGSNIVLDNLEIHYNCQNEVTVTTTPDPLEVICPGLPIEINYEFCHTSGPATNLPVTVGFNVSPTNGLTVTGGGTQTFNLGGVSGQNNCHELTLTLELDGSAPVPNSYEITIEPLADNTCFNGLSESERTLTIDNVTPLPDATFSPPMFTGCNAAFTSLPQTGSHLWVFSDDGGTSTDANPTHLYTADGIFTVTHTVTNACGSDTEELMVMVNCNTPAFACPCPTGNGVNIGAPGTETRLSLNPGLGTSFSGCVAITGTLICDVPSPVTFNGADVNMQPGSSIIVESGNLRVRNGSHLHGCDAMWQGITVRAGAQLLAGENSTIEDATLAVHADGGSTINISEATFNRNLIGLFSNEPFTMSPAYGLIFDCTAPLFAPLAGHYSRAGVMVSNGGLFSIGVNGSAANDFRNLNNGIMAHNNSLMVVNSTFHNIREQGSDDYPVMGYGIHAMPNSIPFSSNTLTQIGLGANVASFNGCTTGIFSRGYQVDVSDNNMVDVDEGIISKFGSVNVDIHGNTINCRYTGIEMSQSDPASDRHIHHNTVNISRNGFGIIVNESMVGQIKPTPGMVDHNMVNMNMPAHPTLCEGISLNSTMGITTTENAVNISATGSGAKGITSSGGYLNNITHNDVIGTGSLATGSVGLYGNNSTNTLWRCNEVSNTYYGFRFDNPSNSPQKFIGNTMDNNESGLYLNLECELGTQNKTWNQWDGSYNNALGAARHEGNVGKIQNSMFITISGFNYWPPSIQTPQAPLAQWFQQVLTNELPMNLCGSEQESIVITDDGDAAIAGGSNGSLGGVKSMSERYLYRKLSGHPGLVVPGTVFEAFYNQNSNSTVGQFNQIEAGTRGLFELDYATQQELDDNYDLLSGKLASLRTTDAQLATATGQAAIDLAAARASLLQEITTISQDNEALLNGVKLQRATGATAIRLANDAIATPNLFEQNEKTVNELFLTVAALGTPELSPAQVAVLTEIANQCPSEGGTAVFQARSLLAGVTHSTNYDDGQLCSPQQLQLKGGTGLNAQAIQPGFALYPNPGREQVGLSWVPMEGFGLATIRDLNGRTLVQLVLDMGQGKAVLDVAPLQAGVYSCQVVMGGRLVFTEKYVLIK